MKTKGWGTGTRWEWYRTREVAIFALASKVEPEKPSVLQELEGVLKEFSIPIDVIDGNLRRGEDVAHLQTLFNNSVKDNEINYDKFEEEIREARKEGRLPYGLVTLVDKDRYEFYHPPWQKERAIYGVGVPDGVVILRYTHKEAVRHEFGHMLGLLNHHKGCIMEYECVNPAFCSKCKRQIQEKWQEEIGS